MQLDALVALLVWLGQNWLGQELISVSKVSHSSFYRDQHSIQIYSFFITQGPQGCEQQKGKKFLKLFILKFLYALLWYPDVACRPNL